MRFYAKKSKIIQYYINKFNLKLRKVMKRRYDEASVVRTLAKKVKIDMVNKMIHVNNETGNVGNGSWGKIDYLCHYCGYRWMRDNVVIASIVSDKPSKRRKKSITEETENEVRTKKKKK